MHGADQAGEGWIRADRAGRLVGRGVTRYEWSGVGRLEGLAGLQVLAITEENHGACEPV